MCPDPFRPSVCGKCRDGSSVLALNINKLCPTLTSLNETTLGPISLVVSGQACLRILVLDGLKPNVRIHVICLQTILCCCCIASCHGPNSPIIYVQSFLR